MATLNTIRKSLSPTKPERFKFGKTQIIKKNDEKQI